MKNKLLYVVVVVLCILPILSLAETSTSTARKTIGDGIEAKKEALKTSVQDIKQNALDKIKEIADKYIQNVIERFDAANNRLAKLADRIDSRITKMEVGGTDVTTARELLAAARTKIKTTKTSTLAIYPDIESVATSTATSTVASLREDFKIVKDQIVKAKEDVKAVHAALVDVVNSLKPGDNKLKDSNN